MASVVRLFSRLDLGGRGDGSSSSHFLFFVSLLHLPYHRAIVL